MFKALSLPWRNASHQKELMFRKVTNCVPTVYLKTKKKDPLLLAKKRKKRCTGAISIILFQENKVSGSTGTTKSLRDQQAACIFILINELLQLPETVIDKRISSHSLEVKIVASVITGVCTVNSFNWP